VPLPAVFSVDVVMLSASLLGCVVVAGCGKFAMLGSWVKNSFQSFEIYRGAFVLGEYKLI
jgi:hypothetical protein